MVPGVLTEGGETFPVFPPSPWISRNLRPGSFLSWYSIPGVPLTLHVSLKKSRCAAMSGTVIFAAVRASPRRRGVPRYLSKVLAQVRLIGEPALQRDIAQGCFGLQHVLSRQ